MTAHSEPPRPGSTTRAGVAAFWLSRPGAWGVSIARLIAMGGAVLWAIACARASDELPVLGIAHVAFQSSDLQASRAYYAGILGYEVAFAQTGPTQSLSFKVNDDQFLRLVAVPAPTEDDRLVEIALQVSDVDRTRHQLRERGLEPTSIEQRSDGTRAVTLRDPDGHLIAFVEYTPDSEQVRCRGQHLGNQRVSARLWHTGVVVTNEARARAFYEQALGCVEFWRGAPEGQPTAWINVRLPGVRGDYLEYMLLREPPTRTRLGSMHHVCFQVPEVHACHRALLAMGLAAHPGQQPRVGRNGRWLFNSYDPDGTRTEWMEPTPAAATSSPPGIAHENAD